LSFAEAKVLASAGPVFTMHTPVEAGRDYFPPELMERYFSEYALSLGHPARRVLALGRLQPSEGDFCMTVLALRFASHANGVSRLHGEVGWNMCQKLWPGIPVAEVPIGHITNGVHFPSWTSLEMKPLSDRYLGSGWREEPANGDLWGRAHSIPPEELWRTHELWRERLVVWAWRRVREQRVRRGAAVRDP